jgi:predicted RNA binding protein YcfA (HicA-like mRNA interferase family)
MLKIPGISADQATRAFMKAGFVILRQGSHTVMSNGHVRLTIPRHNPINACTMGAGAAASRSLPFPSGAVSPDLQRRRHLTKVANLTKQSSRVI